MIQSKEKQGYLQTHSNYNDRCIQNTSSAFIQKQEINAEQNNKKKSRKSNTISISNFNYKKNNANANLNLIPKIKSRFSSNIGVLSQQGQIQKKQQIKKQSKNANVYKNIQIIRKVAMFLEKAKNLTVRHKDKLQPIQAQYLQRENIDQQGEPAKFSRQNPFVNIFNGVFLIMLLFGVWLHTYQIVLNRINFEQQYIFTLLGFYIISIVFSLNTELRTQKFEIIKDRNKILLEYLKNELFFESFAVVVLLIQSIQIQILYYPQKILFMISLKTTLRLWNILQDASSISDQVQSFIKIFKFVFKIMAILHFISLLLNLMGKIQSHFGDDKTWVQKNELTDCSDFELYINGYYWASTIMSTVGFGDLIPGNTIQKALISFIQLFCCLFFGYCLNIIGSLIQVIGQSKQKYYKDQRKLNRYLKSLKLQNSMKEKIKQYFYNKHQIDMQYDQTDQQYLFSKMNQNLREQIIQKNNQIALNKCLFMNRFSNENRKKIAFKLNLAIFAPDQTLFDHQSQNSKLYLVDKGKINQFCHKVTNNFSKKRKPIAQYTEDDNVIGWNNLITGFKNKTYTKAQNFALVYEISRECFLNIIQSSKKDFLKFLETKQKILQNKLHLKKDCFVCKKLTHNVVECPRIHYIPKPLEILIKNLSIKNKNALKKLKRLNPFYIRSGKKLKRIIKEQDFNSQDGMYDESQIWSQTLSNSSKFNQDDKMSLMSSILSQIIQISQQIPQMNVIDIATNSAAIPIINSNDRVSGLRLTQVKQISRDRRDGIYIPKQQIQLQFTKNVLGSMKDINLDFIKLTRQYQIDQPMFQKDQSYFPCFNIDQIISKYSAIYFDYYSKMKQKQNSKNKRRSIISTSLRRLSNAAFNRKSSRQKNIKDSKQKSKYGISSYAIDIQKDHQNYIDV